jgi:hypothetical protein
MLVVHNQSYEYKCEIAMDAGDVQERIKEHRLPMPQRQFPHGVAAWGEE